jgi:pimeloyl-ACP methyl ester carboxylesterase
MWSMVAGVIEGCAVQRVGSGAPVLCIPGFADSSASWWALVQALADRCEVAVLDLPGFGAALASGREVTVAGFAEVVVAVVRRGWEVRVTLVGHSLGSALVVRAAHQLAGQCAAVVSIEGNLTADDGYFSGQAVQFDDPHAFKHNFSGQVRTLVAAGQAPATYAGSVAAADALSIYAATTAPSR